MKLKNKRTGKIVETDFELSISVPDNEKLYGNDTYTQIKGYGSIKDLLEEWEDYEEPKEYWVVDYITCGVDVLTIDPREPEMDNFNKQIGNYFETREEAEKAVKKLEAWKRLKDKGFRFDGIAGNCIKYVIDVSKISSSKEKDELNEYAQLIFGGGE